MTAGTQPFAHNRHRCCAGDAQIFTVAPVDGKELQSLSPPFRVYKERNIHGCAPKAGWIPNETEDIDYYITHTATACAQACIAWNVELTASGRSGTPCNVAGYRTDKSEYDLASIVDPTGSTDTYTLWNCFLKSIKDICSPLPPPASVAEAGANLLVLESSEFPCALGTNTSFVLEAWCTPADRARSLPPTLATSTLVCTCSSAAL